MITCWQIYQNEIVVKTKTTGQVCGRPRKLYEAFYFTVNSKVNENKCLVDQKKTKLYILIW